MSAWLDEWNRRQDVYISDRHRDRHFHAVAQDLVPLFPVERGRLLDYGPGDALFAHRIAEACGEVVLCEAADTIRVRLADRFDGHALVSVIEPKQLADLEPGSVDLMVVHSVAQYLTPQELDDLLREAHRLLAPRGRLVVSDLVPPGVGLLSDTGQLLRFAAREGFLLDAVRALVRLAVSPYARQRSRHGLTRLDERGLTARARRAGLTGRRMPRNVGNNQARWTFLAHRTDAAGTGAAAG